MASATSYHTLDVPEDSIPQASSKTSSDARRVSSVCMTRSGLLLAAFLLGAMVTGIQIRHKPEDYESEVAGMTGCVWCLCVCVCAWLGRCWDTYLTRDSFAEIPPIHIHSIYHLTSIDSTTIHLLNYQQCTFLKPLFDIFKYAFNHDFTSLKMPQQWLTGSKTWG